jgi:PhzF family phenazine biosynthesis protein
VRLSDAPISKPAGRGVPIYQIDAFADRLFSGNPAAVMLLDEFPNDTRLSALAAENNLAETAFLVPEGGDYRLRWFTPTVEVPLCGHATLASAAAVCERIEPGRSEVRFQTASGWLTARRRADGKYAIDLPTRRTRPPKDAETLRKSVAAAIGADVAHVEVNAVDVLAEMADGSLLPSITPDIALILGLPTKGLIVTAGPNGDYDFRSRYFTPANGIPEDPVTGGAHTALVPYWAARLGKSRFLARQCSARGGVIDCSIEQETVTLVGDCVFYMEGLACIVG